MNSLSQQQTSALFSFHQSLPLDATTYLNPSNPEDKNFIETMLDAAGRTDSDYPHLFQSLSSNAAYTGDTNVDKVHLVDSGMTPDGKAIATVWSRSNEDTMINGGKIMVFDSDNGDLLAHGENTSLRNGFLVCTSDSDTALPPKKNLSILYLGHVTDSKGAVRFFSYSNRVMVGNVNSPAAVNQPIIVQPGNTQIHIAVGRGGGAPSNSDYVYLETQVEPGPNPDLNPFLIVPFVGNATLSASFDLPNLTIDDIYTSVFVNNGQGGTKEVPRAYTTDTKMLSGFSVGTPPNIVKWNFPYGNGGSYTTTTSIVYNQSTLGNEIDSFFYFAFKSLPLVGGGVQAPFYVCSNDTPGVHSNNCTKIPNLYFWWHCLAKGTLVTMEDGTQMPIEKINETCRVKTGVDGKGLAVCATVLGNHKSDGSNNEIYQLVTENKKTITATQCHMVFISADKCRMISHIVAGDTIVTDEGISKVVSNKSIAGDALFYGLALGNVAEQASKDFPMHSASYYGNGILCGDQMAMRHHVKVAHHDLDYMLPKIKAELRTDYTSALNHKQF